MRRDRTAHRMRRRGGEAREGRPSSASETPVIAYERLTKFHDEKDDPRDSIFQTL